MNTKKSFEIDLKVILEKPASPLSSYHVKGDFFLDLTIVW